MHPACDSRPIRRGRNGTGTGPGIQGKTLIYIRQMCKLHRINSRQISWCEWQSLSDRKENLHGEGIYWCGGWVYDLGSI